MKLSEIEHKAKTGSLKHRQAARQSAYITNTAPSNQEIGWIGHRKKMSKGSKTDVQIKFNPNDPDIKDNYIYHTHPITNRKEQNPLSAMPSEQDLLTALKVTQDGLQGVVTYHGKYYTVVVPTSKIKPKTNYKKYNDSLHRGDIEDAIKELEKLGFDIETGKL